MATYKNGIMGAFSGKVGAVCGASWRGIDYMRGLPTPSNKPATPQQAAQRLKMTLFRGFLLGLTDIIEDCFQNYKKKTAMNSALSYNMIQAVAGTAPEPDILFPNLIYSKGDLLSAWSLTVASVESNTIDFSWKNGGLGRYRTENDLVHVVVYCPEEKEFSILKEAAVRSDEGTRLIVPPSFKGKGVHCYISFYSPDLGISSTNEYLGEVTVF